MIIRIYIILLIVVFAITAVPSATEAKTRWTEEVFVVKNSEYTDLTIHVFTSGCQLSPTVKEDIKKGITFLYNFFHNIFNFRYEKSLEIKVRFFGDRGDFKTYQRKVSDSNSDTGFYSNKANEIVILFNKDEPATLCMTYHEAGHFFIRHYFYRLPMWIGEGLGEYFRGLKIDGKKIIAQYDLKNEAWLKYWLANGMFVDLVTYIDMPYEEWLKYNKRLYNAGYITSWSLIYFFMSGEGRQTILKDILHYLAQYHIIEQPSLAFNACYPGGVGQLEKDWLDWLMQTKDEHIYSLNGQ